MRLKKLTKRRRGEEHDLFAHLASRADAERDAGQFAAAAVLYGEALRLAPDRADLRVQQGHMLKESGDPDAAEKAYLLAAEELGEDPDLLLQLGHLYKIAGRPAEAHLAYSHAAKLQPHWEEPGEEVQRLADAGWRGGEHPRPAPSESLSQPESAPAVGAGSASALASLVPELAPRGRSAIVHDHGEELHVRQFGRPERGFWGNARTVRGIEAIRGFCSCARAMVDVRLSLNGLLVHVAPLRGGYEFVHARQPGAVLKYVFNIWHDFGTMAEGRYDVEIRCRDIDDRLFIFRDVVVIASPLVLADAPQSDALVLLPHVVSEAAILEREIRALPSVIRPAERRLFATSPRNVLVMRTDQLGDVISSMAAVRRLRELLPDARIVGLLTAANADLARTLDLYDEVIVIDFPDDAFERRRIMPLAQQQALRRRLEPYGFDLAIDLSQSDVSRPLLLLSGAAFLYGVGGGDWPWLTAEFGLNTHDRLNRLDRVPHSAKTLALIETLGALLTRTFEIRRREELDRTRLARFGLDTDEAFVVLHMGARIAFSRWPHFAALATMILARTKVHVVLMTEDEAERDSLPGELRTHSRFHLIDQRLPFDDFDALVSFCTVLVGNDSGPKHLAALRGVHVVTLFTARINWVEWAQEDIGTVISRRVPCAGCALFHDAEECGKDFSCIRDIRPEEVFAAMALPLPEGQVALS